MRAKTILGVFIGYHIHAGGLWSGDYLVADLAPFRQGESPQNQRCCETHLGKLTYPVAVWRQKRIINDADFGAPTDPEMPGLYKDTSDDEAPPRPLGSSSDGVSAARLDPVPPSVPRRTPTRREFSAAGWVVIGEWDSPRY